ncbi:MAG TPA: tetratricopeptide repeat protein, partial [Thermohalobaculum sp.]|nr:tetratricopeptide repeat protein [Thermohalobaculum sp.]
MLGSRDDENAATAALDAARRRPDFEGRCLEEAKVLMRLGRWREATEVAQAFVGRWPDRPEAHLLLIAALGNAGEPARAAKAVEEALERWPNRTRFAGPIARLALEGQDHEWVLRCIRSLPETRAAWPALSELEIQARLGVGDARGAEQVAAEAASRWPDGLAFAEAQVRTAFGLERWDEAVERADRVLARWPDSPDAATLLVNALLKGGAFEAAEQASAAAAATWPDRVDFAALHVRAALGLGRPSEAIARADDMLSRWPEAAQPLKLKIDALLAAGDEEGAAAAALDAARRWPGSPARCLEAAKALSRLGRAGDAAGIARACVERWPDQPDGHRLLIAAHVSRGAFEAAEDASAAAVALWPESVELLKAHVRTALGLERWDDAVLRAERLIARRPDDRSTWLALIDAAKGAVAWPNGFVPPVDQAEAMAAEEGDGPEPRCAVIRALAAEGRLQDAETASAAALAAWPEDALVRFHADRLAEVQRALSVLERAIERFPDDPGIHCQRINLLLRMGRPEEAARVGRSLVERWPESEGLRYAHLAALTRAGRTGEAVESLEAFLLRDDAPQFNPRVSVAMRHMAHGGHFSRCLRLLRTLTSRAEGDDRTAMKARMLAFISSAGFYGSTRRLLRATKVPDAQLTFVRARLEEALTGATGASLQQAAANGEIARGNIEQAATWLIASGAVEGARDLVESSKEALGAKHIFFALTCSLHLKDHDGIARYLDALRARALSDCRVLFFMRMVEADPALRAQVLDEPAGADLAATCALLATEHQYRYRELRRFAHGLRDGIGHADDDATAVSFICPVHRIDDLERLLANIRAQRGGALEALICFNNCDYEAAEGRLKALLAADPVGVPLRSMDCGGAPLGEVLNLGMARAEGALLCKIDADDIYLPDYAARIR